MSGRATAATVLLLALLTGAMAEETLAPANEPNYAVACAWWPEIPYIMTPVGVREHLFRYNVFFNGVN